MNWREPFVALLIAFAVAAVLTPVVARFARVVGAVDRPRGRGLAAGGTPLLGGIAIFVAVTLSVLVTIPDGLGILQGQQDRLHALVLDGLAVLLAHAEAVAVERHGAVEILHGNSDVVDAPEHGRGV